MHAAAVTAVHYNCLFASLVPVDTLYFHNHHALNSAYMYSMYSMYCRLYGIGHVAAWMSHVNRFDGLRI